MADRLYIVPILLFSIIVHEIAHGWVALRLGDPTAKDLGRLTFNPIPHIDPVGSILIPLLSLISAGQVFIAWAKPVPVNPMNFSRPRRDDILVSAAGPVSNLLVALLCTLIYSILHGATGSAADGSVADSAMLFVRNMFLGGLVINISLAVFNMIPVPPLDGSHVLASLLPESAGRQYRRIGFLGIFIILILMRWQPFYLFYDQITRIAAYPYVLILRALTS